MKVAVFGAGRMGLRHLKVVCELTWEIVAVMDPRSEALETAGREFGLSQSRLYQDPKRLLAETRPEAVIVAATAPAHMPLTCLAAEAGARYILCEKPMAVSLAACDRMIAVCGENGARLAINHQMRFVEQHQRARQIIESDEFGPWSSITVVAGNIGVAMNGTHYFELLRWMTGEAPAEVSAWLYPCPEHNPRGREFCDAAGSVRVATACGKRLYLEAGSDQGHGIRTVYAGRNGILVADDLAGRMACSVRRAECRALPTSRYGMVSRDWLIETHPADVVAPTRRVLEALIEGRDYPSGEHGRTAVATLVAAHVSSESGHRPIGLEDLPREREFPYP